MSKEILTDVETTGLDKKKHAIWSLSGIIKINKEVVEEFDYRIRPHETALIDDKALQVTGVTLGDLDTYEAHGRVYSIFESMLKKYVNPYDKSDKFIFKGYNADFDAGFIREFFLLNGNKFYGSYFFFPNYDIMQLALIALSDVRHELPNFKLSTVARYLGVSVNESSLHSSKYDIEVTEQVEKKCLEILRNGRQE